MSSLKKTIEKFKSKPESIKYKDLERILIYLNFIKIENKSSHKKFKNIDNNINIIIPVHNNECKDFYKKLAYKIINKIL